MNQLGDQVEDRLSFVEIFKRQVFTYMMESIYALLPICVVSDPDVSLDGWRRIAQLRKQDANLPFSNDFVQRIFSYEFSF